MKLIFLLLDAILGYNSVNVTHKKNDGIPGIWLLLENLRHSTHLHTSRFNYETDAAREYPRYFFRDPFNGQVCHQTRESRAADPRRHQMALPSWRVSCKNKQPTRNRSVFIRRAKIGHITEIYG